VRKGGPTGSGRGPILKRKASEPKKHGTWELSRKSLPFLWKEKKKTRLAKGESINSPFEEENRKKKPWEGGAHLTGCRFATKNKGSTCLVKERGKKKK